MALGVVAAGVYLLLSGAAQDILFGLLGLSSAVAILVGVRRYRPRRPSLWYVLAGAQAAFVTGDIVYSVYENVLGISAPFPSLADAFYLPSYVVFVAVLVLLVRSRASGGNLGNLIDALVVATGVGLVVWVFLMEPYVEDSRLSLFERLISVAYPFMDVMLIAALARLYFTLGSRSVAYFPLATSFVILLVSDSTYAVGVLEGTYSTGSLIDAGWILFYTLFGAPRV